MRVGIDYNAFWGLTPKKLNLILRGYARTEADKSDAECWRTGLYVAFAIGSAIGGSEYPETPLSYEEEINEEDDKKDEIAAVRFGEWANAFNKQIEKQEKENVRCSNK